MKRFALPLALSLATCLATPALPQAGPLPTLATGHSMLTVNAEGRSTRTPDLAVFNAGVTTQGKTAGAALAANSQAMTRVISALKGAGIAERDIQTSNLSINPIYAEPRRLPDGSIEQKPAAIIGYQINNSVSVRQRKLDDYGRVLDTLVSAGANQVNGPSFQLDQPDGALDEARVAAMKKARERADLLASAAGLKVLRILTINESGGYYPVAPVMFSRAEAAAPPPPAPPVQAGELQLTTSVSVVFELAP